MGTDQGSRCPGGTGQDQACAGAQRLLGGRGPRGCPGQQGRRRGCCGDPSDMPPAQAAPAAGTGREEEGPGRARLCPPWEAGRGSLSRARSGGGLCPPPPYLALQGHSPHGQAAHGLVCDLPPAHREVAEGVGQLLGVVLRRDLKQGCGRQEPSVPVGAWTGGGAGPLLRAATPAAPPALSTLPSVL